MSHSRCAVAWALILLASGGCAETLPGAGQSVSYRTLLLTPHRREVLERQYPGAPAVHLYVGDRLSHRYGQEQWWFDHEQTLRYLLLEPRNENLTTFTVQTAKGQLLAAVELATLSPDGKMRRFGRKDLHVEREDDGRVTYKFVYPRTVKGTVIHERYVLRWPDAYAERRRLFYHRILLQSPVPVLHRSVVYSCPRSWSVKVKKPAVSLAGHLDWRYSGTDWQEIHFRRQNVPPLPPEPLTASSVQDGQYLAIQVQRIEHRKGTDLRPSTWEHVSLVLKKAYMEEVADARRYLAPVAQSLMARWRTRQERQRAIIRYVQRAFTLRPWVDWSIPNVLRAVGGSPLQITAVAYHLLRQVGIPVEFVLIHDAADGVFDRDFVSLKELDSPALLLGVGGQGVLAFPWLSNVPIGLVPARLQGQTAMRVSSSGRWSLYTTPRSSAPLSSTSDQYRIRIDRQGRGWVRASERYDGFAAVTLRERLLGMSPIPRATYLAYRVRGPGQREPVRNTRVFNLRAQDRPLILESSYPMGGLWVEGAGERVLRLRHWSPGRKALLHRFSRRYRPFTIAAARATSRSFDVTYPLDWRLVDAPRSGGFANRFGAIQVSVRQSPGRIRIGQRVVLNRVRLPRSYAPSLQRLQRQITRLSGIHLTFHTTGAPAP